MSSQQATLDATDWDAQETREPNPHAVANPEDVRFMDYGEFVLMRREQEAMR